MFPSPYKYPLITKHNLTHSYNFTNTLPQHQIRLPKLRSKLERKLWKIVHSFSQCPSFSSSWSRILFHQHTLKENATSAKLNSLLAQWVGPSSAKLSVSTPKIRTSFSPPDTKGLTKHVHFTSLYIYSLHSNIFGIEGGSSII